MELRDLEYFMTIVREGSLTGAAKALHLSQPGITRSLKALEDELGKQLVIRGSRRVVLTDEGMMLRRRAEELLQLADRAVSEIRASDAVIEGDIYICAGETRGIRFLSEAARRLMDRYPAVRLNISSGDRKDVTEELENGLIDFGILLEPIDATRYDFIPIPYEDVWGVIMKKDDPLAEKKSIHPEELIGLPLIMPRGGDYSKSGSRILGLKPEQLHVAATYSLIFNAGILAADGIGYVVGLDQILERGKRSRLCFRPLDPPVTVRMNVVWKRDQTMSRQARAFLEELRKEAE